MKYLLSFFISLSAMAGDGTISNFDLVDVSASTFKCRYSAGTGTVQDCTPAQAQGLLDRVGMAPVAIGSDNVIDWTQGNVFTKTLSANTTLTFANAVPKVIVVRVRNTASNYILTWPTGSHGASVLWSGSVVPTQSTGAKQDIWTIFYDGSNFHGAVNQDYRP